MTTYEMIRSLHAKGFNWAGFITALRAKVVSVNAAMPHTLADWDAAKGMREIRVVAMEMANFYVDKISKRNHIIAPSDESKAWDSFEGGHHGVWNDRDTVESATRQIAELVKTYHLTK